MTGKQNLKVTIALAGTYIDFETDDELLVMADLDGDGPAEPIILGNFSAPNANVKYFADIANNNANRLNLHFQDVTYAIPDGATKLAIEIRAKTSWWNEIVGFDNIRITSGTAQAPPTISIARNGVNLEVTFTGTLQSASKVDGTFTAVPGNPQSPLVLKPADQVGMTFYRTKGQ